MKINQKILSIPPYVSTSWKNIISLHRTQRDGAQVLVIGLVNGSTIEIPELDEATLISVFAAHENFVEQDVEQRVEKASPPQNPFFGPFTGEPTALLNLPLGLDGNFANMLQHNPDASEGPDVPKEVIQKIAELSKTIGTDDEEKFPKPEPHCNCTHCQIMRAIHQTGDDQQMEEEHDDEEITAEDLKFREWDIKETSDKLYIVSNPLNHEELYNVFLGNPVGCTCGQSNCEHIRAVLNT